MFELLRAEPNNDSPLNSLAASLWSKQDGKLAGAPTHTLIVPPTHPRMQLIVSLRAPTPKLLKCRRNVGVSTPEQDFRSAVIAFPQSYRNVDGQSSASMCSSDMPRARFRTPIRTSEQSRTGLYVRATHETGRRGA